MPKQLAQETLIPLWELKKIKGIDNLATDDLRVPPGFVRAADNVDIDSEDMSHRRKGILEEIFNGFWHSLWSDEGNLCFGVRNGDLVRINKDWTLDILLSSVGYSHMNFVKVVDRVFLSNRLVVGYFLISDGVVHAFPESPRSLRQRMVGAEIIEYFNGRLYAVQDGTAFHSVAYSPMEIDLKANFQPMGGPVTMFHAVEDGIYASAAEKTFFMGYEGETELGQPKFKYKPLLDVPAHKGSPCLIERLDLGKEISTSHTSHRGLVGKAVIFSTSIGIFIGLKQGFVVDCTSDHYASLDVEEGCSLVKWHNGYRQYVFLGQAPPGGSFKIRLPMLTGLFTGTVTSPYGISGRLPLLRGRFAGH
jgi:hypothetical protein